MYTCSEEELGGKVKMTPQQYNDYLAKKKGKKKSPPLKSAGVMMPRRLGRQ